MGQEGVQGPIPLPVKVAGDQEWRAVAAGAVKTCGLNTSGEAYCWDADGQYQIAVDLPAGCTPPDSLDAVREISAQGYLPVIGQPGGRPELACDPEPQDLGFVALQPSG